MSTPGQPGIEPWDTARDMGPWNRLEEKYRDCPPASPESVERLAQLYGLSLSQHHSLRLVANVGFDHHRPIEFIIEWLRYKGAI